MDEISTIGIDIAKHVFQLHGVDGAGEVVLCRRLRRGQVAGFFAALPPCVVRMEACGTAHFWAREIATFGHDVRLMPPGYVKPYVKRNKHDAADAEAVCEAVRRPSMRFVPVKTAEQQAALVAHSVRDLLVRQRRLASAGLSWPLPAEMTDGALETALFAAAGTRQGHRRRVEPNWAEIHRELKRKHVTLTMLWDEYIERCPEGYRYSRFCELYRGWASRLSVTMRQAHIGGDKLFVDYAGDTVPVIVDRLTGQVRAAQIFVAVMGASNFTDAEATIPT